MNSTGRAASAASAFFLALFLHMPGAMAQDFYAGKTVHMIIASAVGGGYDTYGRLVASHIGRHLAGQPSVVPQNMPGASGIRAANHIYTIAPKDGTAIGVVDQAITLDQVLGKPELLADAAKFNWIGRVSGNNAVLFASKASPVKKIEDAFTHELIVSAPGTSSKLRWIVLQNVVGLKAKILTAYKGTTESRLAQQRGEVHALSMPWTVLKTQEAKSLADGSIYPLMQSGMVKAPDLQNIPRMVDLAKNDDDRQLLALFASPDAIGRAVLAPPGVPAGRVADLRKAFMATMADTEFLRDVEKMKLELDPLSGEDLQKLVIQDTNLSPALVARARALNDSVQ